MTSDEHAAFFGQPIAPRGDGTLTQPNTAAASRGGVSSDLSTEMVLTGTTGGNDPCTPAVNQRESRTPSLIQRQAPGPNKDPFRAILIKKWTALSRTSGKRRLWEWKPYIRSYKSCMMVTLMSTTERPPLSNTHYTLTSSLHNREELNSEVFESEANTLWNLRMREPWMGDGETSAIQAELTWEKRDNSYGNSAENLSTRNNARTPLNSQTQMVIHNQKVWEGPTRRNGSTNPS